MNGDMSKNTSPTPHTTKFRSIIGANQIREIVTILNSEPFDENLTLFSFDELDKPALRQVLFKILEDIEPEFGPSLRENLSMEEQGTRITEIMSLVDYPAYHDGIGEDLVNENEDSDIKVVMYYLLRNLDTCRRRAYLGKFLVGVPVPEEFMMDAEIQALDKELKELMDYFKEEHEELSKKDDEEGRLEAQKDEIRQLEREKEQLIIRLKTYQHAGTQTREFLEILKATSELRQSQEEEARLTEKLFSEQKLLENYETDLLMAQQKVATLEEKIGLDVSAEDLLDRARNEEKMLKGLIEELDRELTDKEARERGNDKKLEMRIPDEGELQEMKGAALKLRALLEDLDLRLERAVDEEKEERLEIFRRQVEVVERRKEELQLEAVEVEDSKVSLEMKVQRLKKDMREKGVSQEEMEFDDLKTFQERLQRKLGERNAKQGEMNHLQRELTVLSRTKKVLEREYQESTQMVRDFEEKFGVQGFSEMEAKIEDLTRQKGQIDQVKGQSLEELSLIVQNLSAKIAEKQGELQPLVDQQKSVKQEIRSLEGEYSQKKESYWGQIGGLKDEYQTLVKAVTEKRNEVFEKEIQREQLLEKAKVLQLYSSLMDKESRLGVGNSLNQKADSYGQWMDQRVRDVERTIQVKQKQKDKMRESAPEKVKGMAFVQRLLSIMKARAQGQKENMEQNENRMGQKDSRNRQEETYNRLVME
jgi:intraflagellar transport protein 81